MAESLTAHTFCVPAIYKDHYLQTNTKAMCSQSFYGTSRT